MSKTSDSEPMRSIKDIIVSPIATKISSEEMELRKRIMNCIIATHEPYAVRNDPNEESLRALAERDILRINGNDEVVSIYPMSVEKTDKKVFFGDGRYGYAMCAVDAIGFHYAFGEDVVVEGRCEYCGSKIALSVSGGRVSVLEGGNVHVTYTDLKKQKNWSCCCCNIMHFFDCEYNLKRWHVENQMNKEVFSINLETANKIAWLLFST